MPHPRLPMAAHLANLGAYKAHVSSGVDAAHRRVAEERAAYAAGSALHLPPPTAGASGMRHPHKGMGHPHPGGSTPSPMHPTAG